MAGNMTDQTNSGKAGEPGLWKRGGRASHAGALVGVISSVLLASIFVPAAFGATNQLEFMPEIVRTLKMDGALGSRSFLSFESGTVTTVIQWTDDPQRDRQLHRDLKLFNVAGDQDWNGEPQWTGVELQAALAADDMWNKPAAEVVGALSDNLAPPLATMPVTDGVWFFETRDGIYGLMRVAPLPASNRADKGIKVTYKIARGTPPVNAASMEVPFAERIRRFIAGQPATSEYGLELWVQDGSGNLMLRDDLTSTPILQDDAGNSGVVLGRIYQLKSADRFYIQWDPPPSGAKPGHYYGPFEGDATKVLGMQLAGRK